MRMKMFAAESMEAAKAMIFAEMGADAVILSEREVDGGVEVRAATDRAGAAAASNEPVFLRDARNLGHGRGVDNPIFARVRDALLWHGAPQRFAERVASEGAGRRPGRGSASQARRRQRTRFGTREQAGGGGASTAGNRPPRSAAWCCNIWRLVDDVLPPSPRRPFLS